MSRTEDTHSLSSVVVVSWGFGEHWFAGPCANSPKNHVHYVKLETKLQTDSSYVTCAPFKPEQLNPSPEHKNYINIAFAEEGCWDP